MAKKTSTFSLQDLKPAAYNPRVMTARARKGLHRSLEKFGDLSGITYNVSTGNLVTGHQRVEELQTLYGNLNIPQAPKVPKGFEVWDMFTDPDGRQWKVRFVNESLDWEMEANIIANSPAISGTFTDTAIGMLDHLRSTSAEDFDVMSLSDIYELPLSRITDGENEPEPTDDKERPAGHEETSDEDLVTANFQMTEGERSIVYKAVNQVRDKVKGASTVGKALAYISNFYLENQR